MTRDPHSVEALEEASATLARRGARVLGDRTHDVRAGEQRIVPALLALQLRTRTYRPEPSQSIRVPKPDGGSRSLLVPTLRDRVAQHAAARWLALEIDASLSDASWAYRPHRSVQQARAKASELLRGHGKWVVRGDIESFFDNLLHAPLFARLASIPAIPAHLRNLVEAWVRTRVEPDPATGVVGEASLWRGLPQGAPISPVLSNIALDALDRALERSGVRHVRFADDFVVAAPSRAAARRALAAARAALEPLGLALHPSKTRILPPGADVRFLNARIDGAVGAGSQDEATPSRSAIGPAETAAPECSSEGALAGIDAEDATQPPRDSFVADPLLRTLYVLEDGATLHRQSDTLVVEGRNQRRQLIPTERLHQIICFGRATLTGGAISLCLEKEIPVALCAGHNRVKGVLDPVRELGSRVQLSQAGVTGDETFSLAVARSIVSAKVGNCLRILRRAVRNHAHPLAQIDEALDRLAEARRRAARMRTLPDLNGCEGNAARVYFEAMRALLQEDWRFRGRRRRPPPDPVNAMLSYGYTVLYSNVLTLVLARGLNPYWGLYHQPRQGHHALVSDLMEEFRAVAVDAVVLDLALNRRVNPGDFEWPASDGEPCTMSPAVRHRLVHALEQRMSVLAVHPGLGRRIDLRRAIDLQVLQVTDLISGRARSYVAYAVQA